MSIELWQRVKLLEKRFDDMSSVKEDAPNEDRLKRLEMEIRMIKARLARKNGEKTD